MKRAVRHLIENPGFTIVALITIALGIGVNTTAFSVLNRLLLQGLPFRDVGSLVQIWSNVPRNGFVGTAPADYFDIVEQNKVFSGVTAYVPGATVSFVEPGHPAVQESGATMTANLFTVLGVAPQLGRLPSPEEEARAEPVTLLSNYFWRKQFAADSNILGRSARLDGKQYTIIGVMPASLDDPALFNARPSFFWLDAARSNRNLRGWGWYTLAARLKPGVTLQQAQGELDVLAKRFAKDHPDTNELRAFRVIAYPTYQLGDNGAQLTWTTLGLTGVVLLIACINLANLQLVRTTRRSQEIAIRLALGCPRHQLIGMLILESVLVSVVGGAIGIVLANGSNAYVARFFQFDIPLDWRVIAFTFVVSVLTGVIFGTVPAWIASRTDVNATLKSGMRGSTSDRSRHWLRQGLVVVEIGMALTLLAGAGFFVTGIYRLTHRELGWNPKNEIMGAMALDHDHYGEHNDPRSIAFWDQLRVVLEAIPGVQAASVSSGCPAWGSRMEPFWVEGQPPPVKGQETYAGYFSVSPGWFEVYGFQMVQGRPFTEADRAGSQLVAIVNETLARKYWPGESPIGKHIGDADPTSPRWAEVVGVIRDFKGGAEFYNPNVNGLRFLRPWAQDNNRYLVFCVRTVGPPGPLKEVVRKAVAQLVPDLAIGQLDTIEDASAATYAYFVFLRRVLMQIAGLGLLLSGVGIYGVVANLASERTKEIGIRMALGAPRSAILWLFLKNGLVLALVGASLGTGAAFFLVRLLSRLIPILPGQNPWAIGAVAVSLIVISLVACWMPARRATRLDPTLALRSE